MPLLARHNVSFHIIDLINRFLLVRHIVNCLRKSREDIFPLFSGFTGNKLSNTSIWIFSNKKLLHVVFIFCNSFPCFWFGGGAGGGGGGGGGALPIIDYTPERGTFFRLAVYERVGISRVEVHKRVGKNDI